MAKTGIDYFSLDVGFLRDKKIKLIKGEFGAKGILIVVHLLCSIYEEDGYYKGWDEDDCYLTADAVGCGITPELINQVVQGCVRRDFFDESLFNMFGVLTSRSIQRRYCRAAYKRDIEIFEEYLLLDLNNPNDISKATSNKVTLKSLNSRNSIKTSRKDNNDSRKNKQSKVKESNNNIYMAVVDYLNEKCGTAYQNTAVESVQLILDKLSRGFTYEDFIKVIDIKAADWLADEKMQKFLRPSTLFGKNFESYLNQKPVHSKRSSSSKKQISKSNNKFNKFPQREYTAEALSTMEQKLLRKDQANE